MSERSVKTVRECVMGRMMLFAAMLAVLALAPSPAAAGSGLAAAPPSDLSAQSRRADLPGTRLRVYPGRRLLYRDCDFRLVQEWRPSGVYIVPRQRCWWVRG